jgi:cysteine sulfinate desulfinase/cysteine desulfurase-like protein
MSMDVQNAATLSQRKKEVKRIKRAKESVTDLIGAKRDEVCVFLPSKEEVLLRALYEVLAPQAMRFGRNEILVSKNESDSIKSILTSAGRLGLSFKEVDVDSDGRLTRENFEKVAGPRTLACFLSWAEHFSGSIHPVSEIGSYCKEKEIYFLVDATESVGKVFFRWQELNVDLLMFTKENLTAAVMKKSDQMQKDKWGEDFSLKSFYQLSDASNEALEQMDMSLMSFATIKNDVMDRLENSLLECRFFNRGANFLPDRWCFAFKGVLSENLAYFLQAKGIEVQYQGVSESLSARGIEKEWAECGVSLLFSGKMTQEEIFDLWDEVIKAAGQVKEVSYESV